MKKIKLLEKRLNELELNQKKDAEMVSDLLDYLMRVDANFVNHPGSFEGWYMRLVKMRNDDTKAKECYRARRLLEENGYVVANDESELDAARVRKWVETPPVTGIDDDIPF